MTRMSPSRRRALELLAQAPEGVNEAMLRVDHGIDELVTIALIEAGLVSASRVRQHIGNRVLETLYLRITPAGREALR